VACIDPTAAPGSRPHYAGIGSRQTPPPVLELIETIAAMLARDGWVLRTGMSPGADQAFYRGARAGRGRVELYLPWPGFEAQARDEDEGEEVRELAEPSAAAYELSARFRPGQTGLDTELDPRARDLLARDAHQVLGADLATPVGFVVCWTPDSSLDGSGPGAGGTGQALRIANASRIPAFNLARAEHARQLSRLSRSRPSN
jgi:hypothetical protein